MKRHMPNQSDLSNYGRLLGVMLITAAQWLSSISSSG